MDVLPPRTLHDVFWAKIFALTGFRHADIVAMRTDDAPDITKSADEEFSVPAPVASENGDTFSSEDASGISDRETLQRLQSQVEEYVAALQALRVENALHKGSHIKLRSFVEEKRYQALRARERDHRVTTASIAGEFESLDLSGCALDVIAGAPPPPPRIIAGLQSNGPLNSVKELKASSANSTKAQLGRADPYELVTQMSSLRTLVLSRNNLVDLYDVQLPPRLQTFVAANNRIETFRPCSTCANLVCVSLAGNALSSVDFLSQLPSLRVLDVSFNRVADLAATVAAIDGAEAPLLEVHFRGNPIALLSAYRFSLLTLKRRPGLVLDDQPATATEIHAWSKLPASHWNHPPTIKVVFTELRASHVLTAATTSANADGAAPIAGDLIGKKAPAGTKSGDKGGAPAPGKRKDNAGDVAGAGVPNAQAAKTNAVLSLRGRNLAGLIVDIDDAEACVAAAHQQQEQATAAASGPAASNPKAAGKKAAAATATAAPPVDAPGGLPASTLASKLTLEHEWSSVSAATVEALLEPFVISVERKEGSQLPVTTLQQPTSTGPTTASVTVTPSAAAPPTASSSGSSSLIGRFLVDVSGLVLQGQTGASNRADAFTVHAPAAVGSAVTDAAPTTSAPTVVSVSFTAPFVVEQAWVCQRRDTIRRLRQQIAAQTAADKELDRLHADALKAISPVPIDEKPSGKKPAGGAVAARKPVATDDHAAQRKEESHARKAAIEELSSKVEREEKLLNRVLQQADAVVLVGNAQLVYPSLEYVDPAAVPVAPTAEPAGKGKKK